MLVSALGSEVVARAALLQYAGNFTAYITMPNWITVFLAGCYMGQKDIRSAGGTTAGWTAVLLAGGALWLAVGARAPLAETFPIMTLAPASLAGALAVSVAVSVVYLGTTLCAFAIFATCPSSRVVAFFARNTLIVFVAHMPVVYWLLRVLPNPAQSAWTSAVLILVCLPGLAGVSEIVRSATPITALRSWARRRVVSREPSSTAAVPVSA
jgi:hypothetical protein